VTNDACMSTMPSAPPRAPTITQRMLAISSEERITFHTRLASDDTAGAFRIGDASLNRSTEHWYQPILETPTVLAPVKKCWRRIYKMDI
jgi:hypothetical protein